MFQINCHRSGASTNNAAGGNVDSVHWNTAVNYSWEPGTSYFRIDGQTPVTITAVFPKLILTVLWLLSMFAFQLAFLFYR